MRYRISHATRYAYSDTVTLSQNLAHLTPRADPRQYLVSRRLEIDPTPSTIQQRPDYFGNPTDAFVIAVPHRQLAVMSTVELDLEPTSAPDPANTPAWNAVAVQGGGDEASAWEFRFDSLHIPCSAPLRAFAQADFPIGRPVLAAALALMHRLHHSFVYDPAATSIDTPVLEVLERRRGVCQDFAQVMIGCLRTLGLCARYVSGYLETTPPPGRQRLVGADATHAWLQLWCGPEHSWIDLDPTNNCCAGEHHLLTAIGRDFADVSPLKGMVLGGGRAEVAVSVDVERID